MIPRLLEPRVLDLAGQFPALTLTGPRQSGKSTLCRELFADRPYVNLESPDERAFAVDDPRAFLAQFPDGAVVDEIQRAPELPSYLQGILDADPRPGRWVLTGSQNLALLESVSQSLAGRTGTLNLLPLTHDEVLRFPTPPSTLDGVLWSGGYPRIFDQGLLPNEWLGAYVTTYIERDVRSLARLDDVLAFQRFIELCAGRTGQLLNYASLASDAGATQPTAKSWLSLLETSFLTFRLPAFHANLRKRVVKTPKLHFHDVGLASWLIGVRSAEQLRSHPLRGALFESWVVTEIQKQRVNRGEMRGLSFYRDRNGAEADLIIERADRLTVVEVKASATASNSLFDSAKRVRAQLDSPDRRCEAIVVYGGDEPQRRSDVRLVPWSRLHEEDWIG